VISLRLASSWLVREPARTAVRVLVLAAAVSLLGSMLVFISHSLSTMTGTAVRSVPVDWQGPVGSQAQATSTAARVGQERGVLQASPVATAPFAGAVHHSPAGIVRSFKGSILAVPPDYTKSFHTIRFLQGGLAPGQVVLDQQLAATLQAQIGDTISVSPTPGAKPQRFKVSGVGVVSSGDVLFQPLNPVSGPTPAQPPAEVIVMPFDTFASSLASSYSTTAPSSTTNAVPGAQSGVQWQVQAQVDPAALSGSPSSALGQATGIRNRVERDLTGSVQFVDNLEADLTTAAGDALYAETLYIMLAVPGALIALGLAYLAALGTAERDRRELALLRARGATRRDLFTLAAVESAVLGVVSGLLGAALAVACVSWLVGRSGLTATVVIVVAATCVVLAIGGALAARLAAISDVLRASISEARQTVRRDRKPLWQRLHLDVLALGVSGLIYWLTSSTGFSAVVNPDSNPTLSLSVYMFFAPALLWIGATLLMVRLRGSLLAWTASRLGGSRPETLRGFVLASAGRRGAAINRGLVVAGLLLAFGVNLGLFTATYDQQALVDAQLTLGADVAVTAPSAKAAPALQSKVASVPGVSATTALDHAYAYIGPDLQDTYGIDPSTFPQATTLRDSYFLGGSAQTMIDRLKSTKDGILVSRETIKDYQLNIGDLLRLRVLDHATGKFRVAPFHVVGIVQEFPSAPKDSFMVTNLAYLEQVTNGTGPNVIFAKTSGDASAVARRVNSAVAPLGASVKNIEDQVQTTTSSITTVDLSGISRIEQAFSLILAAGAMSLFVGLAIGERRQELATMAALGASVREISAFLWSEVVMVLGAALILAAALGWLLSLMLVAMLQHVFDPPPDHLWIPWTFLIGLGASAILAAAVAAALTIRTIGRMPLGAILREE
jgi:putative ABC transport system permease protein